MLKLDNDFHFVDAVKKAGVFVRGFCKYKTLMWLERIIRGYSMGVVHVFVINYAICSIYLKEKKRISRLQCRAPYSIINFSLLVRKIALILGDEMNTLLACKL
ncbi:hypothetical protein VNO78_08218 [Psophocarpus tetragonolobus]|uniref:Uncharacterized protein n=1 Tax=Psophocarpus tetragonolobus TaxID=3891 RepID=A0AAN9SVN2_PSOTE